MANEVMTLREAAREWVKSFNAIPTSMVSKLWKAEPEDWSEVTYPEVGNSVYAYNYGSGEIIKVNYDDNRYTIKLASGNVVELGAEEMEIEYDGHLPMWGTMWSFGESVDKYWLDDGGIELMSGCGFRIFKSEEFGYFFGIDGAGYDFYEAHWIPLYEERGLKWHSLSKDDCDE